jgi:hypothetical protein
MQLPETFISARGLGFSKQELEKSEAKYLRRWSLTYQTLRSLCRDHPGHQSERDVAAKVWLIGRAYATQIERSVKSQGGQGSSLDQVVSLMHKSDTDEWLTELPDEDGIALTDELIPGCIRVHARLVRLLESITHDSRSPRSFASKYLHFHRPVVPIYDSVASWALGKLVRWRQAFDCDQLGEPEDVIYRQFLMHLRQLQGQAHRAGVRPSVRELDWYLMHEAERLSPP